MQVLILMGRTKCMIEQCGTNLDQQVEPTAEYLFVSEDTAYPACLMHISEIPMLRHAYEEKFQVVIPEDAAFTLAGFLAENYGLDTSGMTLMDMQAELARLKRLERMRLIRPPEETEMETEIPTRI